jgi:hypothetical protein
MTQCLIGLIEYSYHQGIPYVKNFRVKRVWPREILGWLTDQKVFPMCINENKSAQKRLELVCRASL